MANNGFGPHVWNQSVARRILLGGKTRNPTIAATALLGKSSVTRASRVLKSYGRRRAHKGNPLPALAMIFGEGGVAKLFGGLFGNPKTKERAAYIADVANVAKGGQGIDIVHGNPPPGAGLTKAGAIQRLKNIAAGQEWPAGFDKARTLETAASQALMDIAAHPPTPAAKPAPPTGLAGSGLTPEQLAQIAVGVGGAAGRPGRLPPGYKWPTQKVPYIDPFTGLQKFKSMRIPGAAPVPKYGAVAGAAGAGFLPGGGAAAAGGIGAGGIALAGAAGVAAFLATTYVQKYLANKTLSREQAGVQAALAHKAAMEDYRKRYGKYPAAGSAEALAMGNAYRQALVELGYDPVTFTRERSWFEKFNPFAE